MTKQHYTWSEYQSDVTKIFNNIRREISNPHIVALYRGALPLGTHLSNIMNAPISILKYQSYDGNDMEMEFIHNAGIKPDDTIVIVDDLGDSYESLVKTYHYFDSRFPQNKIASYTLFGRQDRNELIPNNTYIREHRGKWIVFPWEVL